MTGKRKTFLAYGAAGVFLLYTFVGVQHDRTQRDLTNITINHLINCADDNSCPPVPPSTEAVPVSWTQMTPEDLND